VGHKEADEVLISALAAFCRQERDLAAAIMKISQCLCAEWQMANG